MPVFATNTVHGLSADVYFNVSGATPNALRVFGEITVAHTIEKLDLTANDEGNVNPVATLRRGDVTLVTVPLSDTSGLPTLSGVVFPFASGVAGVSGTEVVLPKAVPGDNYLNKAKELRLVLRDGSATWIFGKAVVTEVAELALSEEAQTVYAATFTCYRLLTSGIETPFKIISGSVVSGASFSGV